MKWLLQCCFHCVKSVQIRSYFWSVSSRVRTEYGPEITPYLDTLSLRIQSECRKIRTRNSSVFGYFWRSFPVENCLLVWLLLWITIDLNLSGLTIIWFSENDLIAFWDSVISISISNVTNFANNDNVLSSAKLCTDTFLMQKKKTFQTSLNNIRPTIEPFGTPEIMSVKSLQMLFLWAHCLQFFKYV